MTTATRRRAPVACDDLYGVRDTGTGRIKIGRARNVALRQQQLQTGCPNPLEPCLYVHEAGWLEPEITPNDAFRAEIERLIDVLERGGRHPLDGHSARAGHEILMAAYESARRRARIDLPLDVPENPLEALVAEHGV